jgi:hypothetical protein
MQRLLKRHPEIGHRDVFAADRYRATNKGFSRVNDPGRR